MKRAYRVGGDTRGPSSILSPNPAPRLPRARAIEPHSPVAPATGEPISVLILLYTRSNSPLVSVGESPDVIFGSAGLAIQMGINTARTADLIEKTAEWTVLAAAEQAIRMYFKPPASWKLIWPPADGPLTAPPGVSQALVLDIGFAGISNANIYNRPRYQVEASIHLRDFGDPLRPRWQKSFNTGNLPNEEVPYVRVLEELKKEGGLIIHSLNSEFVKLMTEVAKELK